MTAPTEAPTMTPEQAWERRVEEARAWAGERIDAEADSGDRHHLLALMTHVRILEVLLDERTEERDALLGAAKGVLRDIGTLNTDTLRYDHGPSADTVEPLRDAIENVEGER